MPPNVRRLVFPMDRCRPALGAEERWTVMFTLALVSSALFLAGVAPPFLVGAIALACALGEGSLLVDRLLLLRNPLAEVRELPSRRWE